MVIACSGFAIYSSPLAVKINVVVLIDFIANL